MLRARPTKVVEAVSYHIGRNLLYGILGVSIFAVVVLVIGGIGCWIGWGDNIATPRFYRAMAWLLLVTLALAVLIDLALCGIALALLPGRVR